jgi:hypothetical protein
LQKEIAAVMRYLPNLIGAILFWATMQECGWRGGFMREDKRSFFRNILAGLGAGTVAAALSTGASAQRSIGWTPTPEPQDHWLDEIGGRHRQAFDTISTEGVARALTFTYTFYAANRDGYGIEPKDLGVIMIFRAGSTPYGFGEKIWSKYSAALSKRYKLIDPTTKSAPVVNIYDAPDKAAALSTNGLTLDALAKMGGRFAICSVASRKLAAALAEEVGGSADAIYAELEASVVPNARMVPAGIIAVNRAQEHGFSICYTA